MRVTLRQSKIADPTVEVNVDQDVLEREVAVADSKSFMQNLHCIANLSEARANEIHLELPVSLKLRLCPRPPSMRRIWCVLDAFVHCTDQFQQLAVSCKL